MRDADAVQEEIQALVGNETLQNQAFPSVVQRTTNLVQVTHSFTGRIRQSRFDVVWYPRRQRKRAASELSPNHNRES